MTSSRSHLGAAANGARPRTQPRSRRITPIATSRGYHRAVCARLPLASRRNPRHRTPWAPPPSPDTALIAASARGGALEGAAVLVLFGLGTTPALLGVSVADELLARNRAVINRLSQVFLLAMGSGFCGRGSPAGRGGQPVASSAGTRFTLDAGDTGRERFVGDSGTRRNARGVQCSAWPRTRSSRSCTPSGTAQSRR
jgi:hypothetical protein